jgi:hypothetical protein
LWLADTRPTEVAAGTITPTSIRAVTSDLTEPIRGGPAAACVASLRKPGVRKRRRKGRQR